MVDMKRIVLIFLVAFCSGSLFGQTVIIVGDAFQGPGKFDRRIHDAMVDHAETIVQSVDQSSEIFAFNCSGDGMHHASGVEEVSMHLDSLRTGDISIPHVFAGWKFELAYFIDWAMRANLPGAANGIQLHIVAHNLDAEKLSSQFLWPFTLVFDCVDNRGELLSGIEIIVHSGFNGEVTTQSVNQISF